MYPFGSRPIEIPFDEQFDTERLTLRLPLPGDGAAVYEAMQESLAELRPWMIWANREQSAEETEQIIRESHIAFKERTDLRFHGFLRETGQLVWCGGLHRIDWSAGKFEIGYWLRSPYSGMGYAIEAARGLERLAIEQLGANRIEIRIDNGNLRSIRVAERLGYTLEGTLRQDAWNADLSGLRNTRVYAKVRGVEF
ncbi:GNAT family N-acetyltransferase [Paenibacillus chartarius]|uniref:GNAT family N-acetyltransferase n=1 Tax=Paenibacillus chartarius TaxID=747481 RepID=A0ABV6DVA6_9BACL